MTDGRVQTATTQRTDPDHADRELRGRTYAIPFDTVWNAGLGIASGGLSRWSLVDSDDQAGRIEARVVGVMFKMPATVRVMITLDKNAQTRVDLDSTPNGSALDLGAARRRIRRFIRELDQCVGASSANTLEARTRAEAAIG